jgi:hypothetical protein
MPHDDRTDEMQALIGNLYLAPGAVLVPRAATEPFPVLCFLHGAQEARQGNNPNGVFGHGSPASHARQGSPFVQPFLVVCPQLNAVGQWTLAHAPGVHVLLDAAIQQFGGDANRVYLTGFSFGGKGTLDFAQWPNGGRFRKLWAVDPQPLPPQLPAGRPILIHYSAQHAEAWRPHVQSIGICFANSGRNHVLTCPEAYRQEGWYAWLLA